MPSPVRTTSRATRPSTEEAAAAAAQGRAPSTLTRDKEAEGAEGREQAGPEVRRQLFGAHGQLHEDEHHVPEPSGGTAGAEGRRGAEMAGAGRRRHRAVHHVTIDEGKPRGMQRLRERVVPGCG